jgi:hypothetical protein
VSIQALKCVFAVGLLLIGGWATTNPPVARGQEFNRKVKSKVTPSYPELATRPKITAVVKANSHPFVVAYSLYPVAANALCFIKQPGPPAEGGFFPIPSPST